MPTTNFAYTATGVVFGGGTEAPTTVSGRTALQGYAHTRVDLKVTGTDLVIPFYTFGSISYQVDGGSVQATGGGGNVWTDVTLFTGLTDAGHDVTIIFTDHVSFLDATNTFKVTGSSPAVGYSTGFGPAYDPQALTSCITTDNTLDWTTGEIIVSQDAYANGSPDYSPFPDGSCRFRGTLTGLKIWAYIGSGITGFRVYVDGVDSGTLYTYSGASATWDWVGLGTGYSSGAEHEYHIVATGGPSYLRQVCAVGGTINTSSAITPRDAWAFLGDSITKGDAGTSNDSSQAWCNLVAGHYSVGARNLGLNGCTLHKYNTGDGADGTLSLSQRLSEVTGLTTAPKRVVIIIGYNDGSEGSGTISASTFGSDYSTMLTTLVGALPSGTDIHCLGYLDVNAASFPNGAANRSAFNSAISTAVSGIGSTHVKYIDTTGWISPSTDTIEGLHPNPTGYGKMLGAYIAATAASISLSETTIERGQAGQTIHITATATTLTSNVSDYTVAGGTVTGATLTDSTHATLTVTAPGSIGAAAVTYVPAGASANISVIDTTAPSSPTGVSLGSVTAYSVPLSFTLPSPSPAGETITATLRKNSTVVATGVSSSPYTFDGVVDGDVLKVRSVDDSGNESSDTTVTFHAPSGSGSGTYPTAGQVLSGVSFGPSGDDFTGNITLPGTGAVLAGTAYGPSAGTTGTLTLPATATVTLGTHYGNPGSQLVGTITIPATGDVRGGVTYGPSLSLTGTYSGGSPPPPPSPGTPGRRYTFPTASLTGGGGALAETIRTTPALTFACGERPEIDIPATLPAGVTLADFDTFALYVWEDPLFPRTGPLAGPDPSPAADGWPVAATLAGTASGSTVSFAGVLPADAGFRRYVLAAWALGGTAGPACLVYPTWLTLVPGLQ